MKLSKLRHATASRHLAGTTIARQDTTSFGMRAALKKGGSRYAGEAGEVEGSAARPRLDRPGRKAGGRVCDEDDKYAKGGKIKPDFIKHPGALRESLHVKEGETIPAKKLEKAEHSDNPKLRKRAILAETMKHWKHK